MLPRIPLLNLLAIDTSTEACSVALAMGSTISGRFEVASKRHGELLLPMIEEVLTAAGMEPRRLEGLAFGCGPGSFTGLRIAAGVIQGMALGGGLRVAPISSLAALAQDAYRRSGQRQVLAAIDARMGEIYWGAYQIGADGIARAVQPDCLCAPAAAPLPPEGEWFGIGSGWGRHGPSLAARLGTRLAGMEPERYPRAQEVALLGLEAFARQAVVKAEEALPVYLRDKVVHT